MNNSKLLVIDNEAAANNVVDFVAYVEAKEADQLACLIARETEVAQRAHLEGFLSDLLIELEAA